MSRRKPEYVPVINRVLVMAEHGVDIPLWNRSIPFAVGAGDAFEAVVLGISDALRQRLRDWNETYELYDLTEFTYAPYPLTSRSWVQLGLRLAFQLQSELPDIDVYYFHDDDERSIRQIRSAPG